MDRTVLVANLMIRAEGKHWKGEEAVERTVGAEGKQRVRKEAVDLTDIMAGLTVGTEEKPW